MMEKRTRKTSLRDCLRIVVRCLTLWRWTPEAQGRTAVIERRAKRYPSDLWIRNGRGLHRCCRNRRSGRQAGSGFARGAERDLVHDRYPMVPVVITAVVMVADQISVVLCAWAGGARASPAASTTPASPAAARAARRADRTRPRGPPAADAAYVEGEEPPPRRGGRRSGGAGGSDGSRARGAVMASALGARRSALLITVAQTASNHFAQFDPIAAPLPVRVL